MKQIFKNTITGFISFGVCFLMFFTIMIYPFFKEKSEEKTTLKNQPLVAYSPPLNTKAINIKISIEKCPVIFLLKLLPNNQKLNVECRPKFSVNSNGEKAEDFKKDEFSKQINFSLKGFENIVNYLGGVEIETPYGLPSPSNTDVIIAKDEKLFVYGVSLGALLCNEAAPSTERMAYYCYTLGEVCLKFLKEGDTTLYKYLNNNSDTNISYTDYYDNYKSLKELIKHADLTSPNGMWKDGWFYLK